MKRQLGELVSKITSYENTTLTVRNLCKLSNILGIHEFDIFNKIPDESHVLAINHGFKNKII